MLDYRGIEALYAVIELQSFEAAAHKLRITQPAVSQRIKALETGYGEPLLVRTLPYTATPLGQALIGHFNQLSLLEEALENRISSQAGRPRIAIALNRDSLDTWFLHVLEDSKLFGHVILDVVADDQELTLDYLRKGMVSACLSPSEKAIPGGKVDFLGTMEYVLAASPQFVKAYFPKGAPQKGLVEAPAVKFDRNDTLHDLYLQKFFGIDGKEVVYHYVPSVSGFKKMAVLGYGYCLIPKIDIREELANQQLIPLFPKYTWKVPLYWHSWSLSSPAYQKFCTKLLKSVRSILH